MGNLGKSAAQLSALLQTGALDPRALAEETLDAVRAHPDRAHSAALVRAALTAPLSAARTTASADQPTTPSPAARLGLRRPPAPAARPISAAARLGLRSPLQAPSPAARRTAR